MPGPAPRSSRRPSTASANAHALLTLDAAALVVPLALPSYTSIVDRSMRPPAVSSREQWWLVGAGGHLAQGPPHLTAWADRADLDVVDRYRTRPTRSSRRPIEPSRSRRSTTPSCQRRSVDRRKCTSWPMSRPSSSSAGFMRTRSVPAAAASRPASGRGRRPCAARSRRPRGGGGSGTARRPGPRPPRRRRLSGSMAPWASTVSTAQLVAAAAGEHVGVHALRAQARHLDALVAVGDREPLGEPDRRVLGDRCTARRRCWSSSPAADAVFRR